MLTQEVGYKILIVEDNPGDVILIEDFLYEQIKSLRTKIATSFIDAKTKLSQANNNFDIILLDLTLPDKTGVELLNETIKICNNIPIIVLTGYVDLEFGIKSLTLGASDYILKDELSSANLYKSILYSLERKKITISLKQSEKRYNDLFHLSPLPMWVYDLDTLHFLDVNNAAIEHYGYSSNEFIAMTINDLEYKEDIGLTELSLQSENIKGQNGGAKHKKMNGKLINVDIRTSAVMFNEKKANMVVATDVTEQLEYISTIEIQNEKLKEIAWIQSHVVRAPLARIMAIIPLLKNNTIDANELENMLEYIMLSANELDVIIRDISQKTHSINNI